MSSSPLTTSGRRRSTNKGHSAEDQALDQIAKEAEARLAAKRAERAKAREIRNRELEKKQREEEVKQDRAYELTVSERSQSLHSISTRRSSEIPSAETRESWIQLHELEEKYKKAMMSSAQLDNEKQALSYNVELLKDQMYDKNEELVDLQRDFRDKFRECERLKRENEDLELNNGRLKVQVDQRDTMIKEQGLVIVGTETGQLTLAKSSDHAGPVLQFSAALVTPEAAEILNNAGEGSLDEKLKLFAKEKRYLESELKHLREELEEEREKTALSDKYSSSPKLPVSNGPELKITEIQHEASKQIHEYKLKLQKADQDIATLEGCVNRLENQVKRFQAAAENAEKLEEELKGDKRRLQRELRESKNSIEELQTRNSHLQKRMEKLKQDRIAALVGQ